MFLFWEVLGGEIVVGFVMFVELVFIEVFILDCIEFNWSVIELNGLF